MSNVGKWDHAWSALVAPIPLGGPDAYQRMADWLADDALVEDWGCGPGVLSGYVGHDRYRGVDGSASPFAHVHADLVDYRPIDAPAIAMRTVLEHNDEWERVLDNALASFGARMVIVLFTPMVRTTTVLFREPDYGHVPVIAFALHDLTARIEAADCSWVMETIASPDTAFGIETLLYIER